MRAKLLQSCPTLCNPVAHQAPLSMGFSRQEYWSIAMPSSRASSGPKIEPMSAVPPASPALQADSLPTEPPGKLGNRKLQTTCSLGLPEAGSCHGSIHGTE